MAEFGVVLVLAIVVFVLAMRSAPLWAYAALAVVTWLGFATDVVHGGWQTPSFSLLSIIGLLPVVALVALSVPAIRRAIFVELAYDMVRKILPRVSETEQQALDAGTIGFDAELFSGKPDWEKLRAVPPITLTDEERAFMNGPTEELCRMIDDWKIQIGRAHV